MHWCIPANTKGTRLLRIFGQNTKEAFSEHSTIHNYWIRLPCWYTVWWRSHSRIAVPPGYLSLVVCFKINSFEFGYHTPNLNHSMQLSSGAFLLTLLRIKGIWSMKQVKYWNLLGYPTTGSRWWHFLALRTTFSKAKQLKLEEQQSLIQEIISYDRWD